MGEKNVAGGGSVRLGFCWETLDLYNDLLVTTWDQTQQGMDGSLDSTLWWVRAY